MDILLTTTGAQTLRARLERMRRGTNGIQKISKESAFDLLKEIQERAPVATGNYRDSWHVVSIDNKVWVTTTHPAAYRLEYGFVGVDSLGRHYNQAPRPHVRPAMQTWGPTYAERIHKAVPRWWR